MISCYLLVKFAEFILLRDIFHIHMPAAPELGLGEFAD